MIDFQLSDEQQLIRDEAKRFADEQIAPGARQRDRDCTMPDDILRAVADAGYLGAVTSPEYGGAGMDYRTYALVMEEFGRVDASLRAAISVHISLVGKTIARVGTEAQKQAWLPAMATGDKLACYALTEPNCGSDVAAMSTRAERTNDGWRITGQKQWITMGTRADLALVFAQTNPELRHRGIACFLVPTNTPGYSASPIHGKLGLRSCDTAEVRLDGVEVPADALLGDVGDGFKIAMEALDTGRFSLSAGCVGMCQGALDAALKYTGERVQFGQPLAGFQLIQSLLTDIRVDTDCARMLVWRAGWLKDTQQPDTAATSIAKLFASEAAQRCATNAVQVHGGAGYVDDHPVERFLRDARVTTLYEGTSQIQRLVIGRELTGLNAVVPGLARRKHAATAATSRA